MYHKLKVEDGKNNSLQSLIPAISTQSDPVCTLEYE